VVRAFPGRFAVETLTARNNVELLRTQALEFRPRYLGIGKAESADSLLPLAREIGAELLIGAEGLERAATAGNVDLVVVATVGFAGVAPTLAAVESGRNVALANKEALVCAGSLITAAAQRTGARLLPVDSEHNAIFQCLEGNAARPLRRLILTASGGPFRTTPRAALAGATRAQVLAHPNWDMGAKISVDSATMMNKGLEVIEAMWLFGQPVERISVVVHPQSVVHSMVEFLDGSILAQLGPTDMRLPIQHALWYPECGPCVAEPLDMASVGRLDFEPVDMGRFPLLGLAFEAARGGPLLCTALNAFNEEAVGAFLENSLGFLDMQDVILDAFQACCARYPNEGVPPTLQEIVRADREARQQLQNLCPTSKLKS